MLARLRAHLRDVPLPTRLRNQLQHPSTTYDPSPEPRELEEDTVDFVAAWLGDSREEMGLEPYPGFAATQFLFSPSSPMRKTRKVVGGAAWWRTTPCSRASARRGRASVPRARHPPHASLSKHAVAMYDLEGGANVWDWGEGGVARRGGEACARCTSGFSLFLLPSVPFPSLSLYLFIQRPAGKVLRSPGWRSPRTPTVAGSTTWPTASSALASLWVWIQEPVHRVVEGVSDMRWRVFYFSCWSLVPFLCLSFSPPYLPVSPSPLRLPTFPPALSPLLLFFPSSYYANILLSLSLLALFTLSCLSSFPPFLPVLPSSLTTPLTAHETPLHFHAPSLRTGPASPMARALTRGGLLRLDFPSGALVG
ncbi:hypothetical protein K438DRAFT_1993353 [Mycena galopus ATCC 62051]|nr:hypothetical protein K438DRAFT_1993353 [Mycena galopus ATCC 62051]